MTFTVINFTGTCFRFAVVTELVSVWSFINVLHVATVCLLLSGTSSCTEQQFCSECSTWAPSAFDTHSDSFSHWQYYSTKNCKTIYSRTTPKVRWRFLFVMFPLSFVLHVFRVIPHTEVKCIPLSITNNMQRYAIFFIAVNALHVSGGFSAHHQELKLYTQRLVYVKVACCYR